MNKEKDTKNNKSGGQDAPEEDVIMTDIEYEDESLPQDKLKKLREKLKKCEEEKREFLEGWQRAKADAVNEKKRFTEELKRARLSGKKDALENIIPVLDSFHMAFQGEAWEQMDSTWKSGIEYIFSQFNAALENMGGKEYAKQGDEFDPGLHEALKEVETSDEKQSGKIAKVLRKGFKLDGSVVRPAQVEVYKIQE